jgi:glutaminyl-tRNA synthetase
MRNVPEKLTESHKPRALKPLGQNSDLRLNDHLFVEASPDGGGKDFLPSSENVNLKFEADFMNRLLVNALPDRKFQFDRFGHLMVDRLDHVGSKTAV